MTVLFATGVFHGVRSGESTSRTRRNASGAVVTRLAGALYPGSGAPDTSAGQYLDENFKTVLPQAFLRPDSFRAGVFAGSELPKTPEWQFNISPRYELGLTGGGSVVFLADYRWTDAMWNDTERTLLLKRDAAVNLNLNLNLSVGFQPADRNWDVKVGGTNLTDERSLSSGFSQPGTGILSGTYSRGQEWYVTLGYRL